MCVQDYNCSCYGFPYYVMYVVGYHNSLWPYYAATQFNSIPLFYLNITYNNLILIYNVVETKDDETNNILCTTRHTGCT